jgi:hypothetical protein
MDCRPSSLFAIGYFLVALTDIQLEKAAVPATWALFVDADRFLQVPAAKVSSHHVLTAAGAAGHPGTAWRVGVAVCRSTETAMILGWW